MLVRRGFAAPVDRSEREEDVAAIGIGRSVTGAASDARMCAEDVPGLGGPLVSAVQTRYGDAMVGHVKDLRDITGARISVLGTGAVKVKGAKLTTN